MFVGNIFFQRGFWRIPYLENVIQDLTQLSGIGFPHNFYIELVASGFCVFQCQEIGPNMANTWPQRAGPKGPKGRARAQGPGPKGPGPGAQGRARARAQAQPLGPLGPALSLAMYLPRLDLFPDICIDEF